MIKQINKYYLEILRGVVFLYFSFAYLPFAFSSITLLLLSVLFLFFSFYNKGQTNFTSDFIKKYLLISIPFIISMFLMFTTKNYVLFVDYIEKKTAIILLPFVFLTIFQTKKQLKLGVGLFVLSSLFALFFTLYNLFEIYPNYLSFNRELFEEASVFQHLYFGIYQLVALVFLIEFFRDHPYKILFYLFILLFSLGVIISTSRISYILYVLIVVLYITKLFSTRNIIILLITISSVFTYVLSVNTAMQQKFSRAFVYKTNPRLIIWNNTYMVLKNTENPVFGVGVDYYKEGSKDPYWLRGYADDLKENYKGLLGYNSHNQFFEFVLLTGFFGILYFLLILYTFYKTLKTKNIFLISLMLIITLFSSVENILDRQYGVILYVMLMSIVYSLGINFKKKTS